MQPRRYDLPRGYSPPTTSEAARRRVIADSPRAVPVVELEDQDGLRFTLAGYHGQPVVVDFIYAGCGSVCPLLSDGFRRLDRPEEADPHSGDARPTASDNP